MLNDSIKFTYIFLACNPVIDISQCVLRIHVACHGSYVYIDVRAQASHSVCFCDCGLLLAVMVNGMKRLPVSNLLPLIIFVSDLHPFQTSESFLFLVLSLSPDSYTSPVKIHLASSTLTLATHSQTIHSGSNSSPTVLLLISISSLPFRCYSSAMR